LGLSYDRMVYTTRKRPSSRVNARYITSYEIRPDVELSGNFYTQRGVSKLQFARPLCRQWYNLGEWY
jgi:hypothetical protein